MIALGDAVKPHGEVPERHAPGLGSSEYMARPRVYHGTAVALVSFTVRCRSEALKCSGLREPFYALRPMRLYLNR
jgi:hypothetical protein